MDPSVGQRLDLVVAALRDAFGDNLRSVALFGSHARGDATPGSDIDVVVVLDRRDPRAYGRVADAFLGRVPEPPFVSVVIWSSAELMSHPWLLIDVATDGVILLDDGALSREMDAVRGRLQELGARRIRLDDGTWYWDLKPDWKPGDVIEI